MSRREKIAGICAAMLIFTGFAVIWPKQIGAETAEFKESGKIWVIGDSIASDHDDNSAENEIPITGWGNFLQKFIPGVTVENKARSGRSSKSYAMEDVYKEVMKKTAAGDYMIVQFGHNDEKEAPRYTDPKGDSSTEGSFKWTVKTKYIEPCLAKGMRVILASSVVRHTFSNGQLSKQSHEPYAIAMRELVEEYMKKGNEVYFIDTFSITQKLYNSLGEKRSGELHAMIGLKDAAKMDETHYGPYGAYYMAGTIAKQMKNLGIPCCRKASGLPMRELDTEKLENSRINLGKFAWR